MPKLLPSSLSLATLRQIDWKKNWKWVAIGVGLLILLILLIVLAVILSSSGGDELEAYHRAAHNYHNARRKEHQVGSLELDAELNRKALKCAEYYAKVVKGIDHSCKDKGGAGENLYSRWGGKLGLEKEALAEQASKLWYEEVQLYNYDNPEFSKGTVGHFTAMVWKASTKMGVGVFKSDDQHSVVVALYMPQPNVKGQYKENVLPKL